MEPAHILVVEDEEVLQSMYCSILNCREPKGSYLAVGASSAEQAKGLLAKDEFDVVLADYRLPGRDGISLIREIKERHSDTACLLISGCLDGDLVREALNVGALAFLRKPCQIDDILSAVENALNWTGDSEDEFARIASVANANVLDTVFISPDYDILNQNDAFTEAYGDCVGRKCYDALGVGGGVCPNCQAFVAAESREPKSLNRLARSPRGEVDEIEERFEPWFDVDGRLNGVMLSCSPVSAAHEYPAESAQAQRSFTDDDAPRELMVFAIDAEGRVAYADSAFADFCETPGERLVGSNLIDNLDSFFVEHHVKKEGGIVSFARSRIGSTVTLDFVRGGKRRTISCEFRTRDDWRALGWELLVIARDQEETRLLSQLIAFERESSRQLLSAHFDMIITLDADRCVLTINQSCAQKFERRQAELAGSDLSFLLAEDSDREALAEAFREVADVGDACDVRVDLRPNGRLIPVVANIRLVRDADSGDEGYVVVLRDIASDVRMTAQLARIERMQALGQLTAGVAHQINNYGVALSGFSEIMIEYLTGSRELEKQTAVEFMKQIQGATERLMGLTKHLTSYSRSQEAPVATMGDINAAVDSVMTLVASRARSKFVALEARLTDNLPPIAFSPLHLEQAILNIAMNAIDAVAENTGAVTVTTYQEEGEIHISVEDNGTGIPNDVLPHIFDAFVTTKPGEEGTGLGLSVAQTVVSSLNGRIDVDSIPNQGTTMTISLPIGQANAVAPQMFPDQVAHDPALVETTFDESSDPPPESVVAEPPPAPLAPSPSEPVSPSPPPESGSDPDPEGTAPPRRGLRRLL